MTPYLYGCQINKSWMPHATLISTRQQRLVVVALCRLVLFKNECLYWILGTHFKIVSKAHLIENVYRRKVSIDRLPIFHQQSKQQIKCASRLLIKVRFIWKTFTSQKSIHCQNLVEFTISRMVNNQLGIIWKELQQQDHSAIYDTVCGCLDCKFVSMNEFINIYSVF